jgi:hypothetical protein
MPGGGGGGCVYITAPGGSPCMPATSGGLRMIRYNGRNTIQSKNVPMPHPVAFMGRFFASVYTQYPATAPTTIEIRKLPLFPIALPQCRLFSTSIVASAVITPYFIAAP